MFKSEQLPTTIAEKDVATGLFETWHAVRTENVVKKFPSHRSILLLLGIGVALLIAVTMWTAGAGGSETGEIIKPSIAPAINKLVEQSASTLYRSAESIVSDASISGR